MHTRMRFSCHLIIGSRFYPAGVEIPPDVAVPGGAKAYVLADTVVSAKRTAVPISDTETMVSAKPPEATPHSYLFSS